MKYSLPVVSLPVVSLPVPVVSLQGPPGPPGPRGTQGPNGADVRTGPHVDNSLSRYHM